MWLELRESGEEEADEMGSWGESCRAGGPTQGLRAGEVNDPTQLPAVSLALPFGVWTPQSARPA